MRMRVISVLWCGVLCCVVSGFSKLTAGIYMRNEFLRLIVSFGSILPRDLLIPSVANL